MKDTIKHMLAKKNGREKSFIDGEIGNEVSERITPAEENAQARKACKVLFDILKANNIAITQEQEQQILEFLNYNNNVEKIKHDVKSKYN